MVRGYYWDLTCDRWCAVVFVGDFRTSWRLFYGVPCAVGTPKVVVAWHKRDTHESCPLPDIHRLRLYRTLCKGSGKIFFTFLNSSSVLFCNILLAIPQRKLLVSLLPGTDARVSRQVTGVCRRTRRCRAGVNFRGQHRQPSGCGSP